MKFNIDFIPHWKIFDITEYPEGYSVSFLFLTAIYSKNRLSYYFESCGVGIDYVSTNRYNSLLVRLLAFAVNIQKNKNTLSLVKGSKDVG